VARPSAFLPNPGPRWRISPFRLAAYPRVSPTPTAYTAPPMPSAAGTVARCSTGHRLITERRAAIRRLAHTSAPPVPAAASRAGLTHRWAG
jgi:hypothetical protein